MSCPESATLGPLLCPYCGALLARDARTFRCEHDHTFDIARQGYVYLRRTRNSGDSAEMLRARRAFLDGGHFAPLADLVSRAAESVVAHPPATWAHARQQPDDGSSAIEILDSGCGEGYYLERLGSYLADTVPGQHCRYWGLDSSRDATRMAAGRCRDATFVVGDCKDALPFATGSLHALVDIFAPRNAAEFSRVLAPGGLLLIVVPGIDHLAELRDRYRLLGIEAQKVEHLLADLGGYFSAFEVRTLKLTLDLSPADVARLVSMTPNRRHGAAASIRDEGERVTASFRLATCRRRVDAA